MTEHRVGSREEWRAARVKLLEQEKEHTRRGDELAAQRRELPWVPIEADYSFDADDGTKSLAELFGGRSQLLVYHFMFGPEYEVGCPTCSSIADSFDGLTDHLNKRGVTFVAISRAPLEKLQAYKRRMGWRFPWVSSAGSDFNFDFDVSYTPEQVRRHMGPALEGEPPPILRQLATATGTDVAGYVSEAPGFSAFIKADGAVYHTYSTGARGLEFLMGYYPILDRAPKGRDEDDASEFWIRRHDEYGLGGTSPATSSSPGSSRGGSD
jgi:predicted dithiol-disulfide oxidoreductase (DUF899 family)